MLHIFDIDSNKLIKSVTRKHKRIKRPKDPGSAAIIIDGKRFKAPGSKFLSDINQVVEFRGNLWVQTSTRDKKERCLYDVFDIEGSYLDSFYLNVNGTFLTTHGVFRLS